MRRPAIAFVACLILLNGAFANGSAAPGNQRAAVAPLDALPDPGPQPALDAGDYVPFRNGGSSVIAGTLKPPASVGAGEICRGQGVWLYPNTPYARWAVEAWAREVDGRRLDGNLYPGDRGSAFTVPSYLNPEALDALPTSALRIGHCDWSNNVVVDHVPAGRFILVIVLQRDNPELKSRTDQAIVQTPNGEHPENYESATYVGGTLGDGYVLASQNELVVKAGHRYTFASENFRPIAHFLP